jgi:hypothetical protein
MFSFSDSQLPLAGASRLLSMATRPIARLQHSSNIVQAQNPADAIQHPANTAESHVADQFVSSAFHLTKSDVKGRNGKS